MKIEDLIKLAEAGYSPAMVKDLLSLDSQPAKEKVSPVSVPVQAPAEVPVTPAKTEAKVEETIDYKKLYEESQAALEQSRAALARQNQAPANDKSLDEKVFDIFASYF